MNDRFSDAHNTQFVLSYELLCLFRWLIEHDVHKLNKIIRSALAAGLADEIKKIRAANGAIPLEEMQSGIVELFGLLEGLLLDALKEEVARKARQKKLMPSIDQIDSTVCDDSIVQFSLEKAMESDSDIDPTPEAARTKLFEELLKRWNPQKKTVSN